MKVRKEDNSSSKRQARIGVCAVVWVSKMLRETKGELKDRPSHHSHVCDICCETKG